MPWDSLGDTGRILGLRHPICGEAEEEASPDPAGGEHALCQLLVTGFLFRLFSRG